MEVGGIYIYLYDGLIVWFVWEMILNIEELVCQFLFVSAKLHPSIMLHASSQTVCSLAHPIQYFFWMFRVGCAPFCAGTQSCRTSSCRLSWSDTTWLSGEERHRRGSTLLVCRAWSWSPSFCMQLHRLLPWFIVLVFFLNNYNSLL